VYKPMRFVVYSLLIVLRDN